MVIVIDGNWFVKFSCRFITRLVVIVAGAESDPGVVIYGISVPPHRQHNAFPLLKPIGEHSLDRLPLPDVTTVGNT